MSHIDITSFYGFFSATCFTLVGLWWNVVQSHPQWLARPDLRRAVGGVYLAFFLPALMGLFGQVGGGAPGLWRGAFVAIAVVGVVSTVRLLGLTDPGSGARPAQATAVALYALVGVLGAVPELAGAVGLAPLQLEAVLLILLIVAAHGLVWRFMTGDGQDQNA